MNALIGPLMVFGGAGMILWGIHRNNWKLNSTPPPPPKFDEHKIPEFPRFSKMPGIEQTLAPPQLYDGDHLFD